MGRRAKTIDDLPENWREIIEEKQGDGRGIGQVLKAFGISHNVHKKLMDSCEEYREEIEFGQVLYEAYWFNYMRENPEGKNATAFYLMKAVCGYYDYAAAPPKGADRKVKTNVDFGEKYKPKTEAVEEKIQ